MSNSVEDNNFESGLIEALQTLPKGIVDLFSALNIILATFAFLGNILVIIALCRVLSIAPSTKLFFRCLAVSDLCVGIIVQPIYIYATIVMSSFVRGICHDFNCCKRGQTVSPAFGNKIQTCCIIKASSPCYCQFLGQFDFIGTTLGVEKRHCL